MISDRVTLYSVTSYWHGKLESRGDIDGGDDTGPGFIPFQAQSQDNIPDLDQFTQEIRVASNNSAGLGYQAGVFYFNEDLDVETFDFGKPDRPRHPSRSSYQHQDSEALGHLRIAQLRVRQWPEAAGRRALEP